MPQLVLQDKRGFTLIEFLIALVILSIGLLGVLQALDMSMRHNLSTKLRGNAMMLADQTMAQQHVGIPNVGAVVNNYTINAVAYTVNTVVGNLTANSKTVNVTVNWNDRGVARNYTVSTVIRHD